MIDNNDRTEHRGLRIGQIVRFRFCGANYRGRILRLTNSKVCIQFYNTPHIDSKYVAYKQVEIGGES